MKFIKSIKTVRSNHHIWSISREDKIGVVREGVAKSVETANAALMDAETSLTRNWKILTDEERKMMLAC